MVAATMKQPNVLLENLTVINISNKPKTTNHRGVEDPFRFWVFSNYLRTKGSSHPGCLAALYTITVLYLNTCRSHSPRLPSFDILFFSTQNEQFLQSYLNKFFPCQTKDPMRGLVFSNIDFAHHLVPGAYSLYWYMEVPFSPPPPRSGLLTMLPLIRPGHKMFI